MNTIEIKDAKDSLGNYAEQAKNDPIIITDHGRPIVALLPLKNADMETVSLSTNPEFIALIGRSRRRQDGEGGISSKEMRKRLGIKSG